ncbi:MAG: hypothetical protein AAFQ40_13490 [Cyanobacteria bacterium J06623_5]
MDFSTQTGFDRKHAFLFSCRVLFATAFGLVAVSCAGGRSPAGQIASVELSAVDSQVAVEQRYEEVGADGEPAEPVEADLERLNLSAGMAYGEVRSRVMAQGWMQMG